MNDEIETRLRGAVANFWKTLDSQRQKQVSEGKTDAGSRSAVTGGAQMAAIESLVVSVLIEAGLKDSEVRTRSHLELPGYYRPEKKWDLLALADDQLVMAIEFKSQAGSFGNNFNNRTEEAIGNAEDLWTAYRERRFNRTLTPFLGFFFLLEDCPAVHAPVRNAEPHFKVDPVFAGGGKGVSYAKRYEELLGRLVRERKYNAACLTLSTRPTANSKTRVTFPSPDISFKKFSAALFGHVSGYVKSR